MSSARAVVADGEGLTVAMAIVPGLYARNRLFALFARPEVRRAKARAAMLRGVVRQLAGSHGAPDNVLLSRCPTATVLRYRIARMRLQRQVELSELEAACLVFLASRAGVPGMEPSPDDQARIDAALQRLGGDAAREARRVSGASTAPAPVTPVTPAT